MARISFSYVPNGENEYEHEFGMSFRVKDGMHISELHDVCIQFARAMQFADESIEQFFGKSIWPEEPTAEEFKKKYENMR